MAGRAADPTPGRQTMTNDPHWISLEDALRMVRRARRNRLLPVTCWSIDAGAIERILRQEGTASLRIYLGQNDEMSSTLVFLGADAEGQDQYQGEIAEYSLPCPPNCDDDSPFQGRR